MTNVIYDFTIGWPVSPHIGAGIGAVEVIDSLSINSFTLRNPIGPPISPSSPLSVAPQTFGGTLLNGSSWRFGYQGIAGIRYDFSPAVSFDLDYRYLGTTSTTVTNNSCCKVPVPEWHRRDQLLRRRQLYQQVQVEQHRGQHNDEVRRTATTTPATAPAGAATAAAAEGLPGVLRLG